MVTTLGGISLGSSTSARSSSASSASRPGKAGCLSSRASMRSRSRDERMMWGLRSMVLAPLCACAVAAVKGSGAQTDKSRSEEHTSELQSQSNLVCRLLLEKKKKTSKATTILQLWKHDRGCLKKSS